MGNGRCPNARESEPTCGSWISSRRSRGILYPERRLAGRIGDQGFSAEGPALRRGRVRAGREEALEAARSARRAVTVTVMVGRFLVLLAVAAAFCTLAVPAGAATINVDVTNDELKDDGDCALREAVESANDNQAISGCAKGQGSLDTIKLKAQQYTIVNSSNEDLNASGDFDFLQNGPVAIEGKGPGETTVSQNGDDRVFDIFGPRVTLTGMRVSGGDVTGSIPPTPKGATSASSSPSSPSTTPTSGQATPQLAAASALGTSRRRRSRRGCSSQTTPRQTAVASRSRWGLGTDRANDDVAEWRRFHLR